jgi:hypothetical protein
MQRSRSDPEMLSQNLTHRVLGAKASSIDRTILEERKFVASSFPNVGCLQDPEHGGGDSWIEIELVDLSQFAGIDEICL